METQFFKFYPYIFLYDLLRYLIPAGTAFFIFWVLFKKQLEHLFIQKVFPAGHHLWREFRYSMSTVAIFSLVGYGIVMASKKGYVEIYPNISDYGWIYFFISFILMIVFSRFVFLLDTQAYAS